jgi:hypothetical protein
MLLTRDCSVLTAHSELLFSAISLQHRQLQLSVQAGTVREERERESRNDVYDRKSFYDAHCTVHNAHGTVHRAQGGGWWRLKHEDGRNCCFLMLSLSS